MIASRQRYHRTEAGEGEVSRRPTTKLSASSSGPTLECIIRDPTSLAPPAPNQPSALCGAWANLFVRVR